MAVSFLNGRVLKVSALETTTVYIKGLVGLYWSNFHVSFKLHGYLHQDMMSIRRAHRKEQHFAK